MKTTIVVLAALVIATSTLLVIGNWHDLWLVLPCDQITARVEAQLPAQDFDSVLAWATDFCDARDDRTILSASQEVGVQVVKRETIGDQHIYLVLGDHVFTGGTRVGCVFGFDSDGRLQETYVFKTGTFMR